MYWVNLGLIFVAGLNLGLALLIWLINPKNKINITFALGVFFVATWTLGIAMFRESQTETMALVWTWVQNASGSYIVIPFFLFSLYFPYQNYVLRRWQIALIALSAAVITLVVVISNAWVIDIRLSPHDNDYLINAWGVGYFNLHFYFYLVFAFYNLLRKYKSNRGFIRKQLSYVILFTGIIALFGGIFGALIPLMMLSTAGPYWLGPYFSLPMVIFLSRFVLKKD
jgi:hypothetical protein